MKKKILLSLSSFVVLCIAVGAISVIKKPVTSAEESLSVSTLASTPAPEGISFDIPAPTCGDVFGELTDCFPLGEANQEEQAKIALDQKSTPVKTQTKSAAPVTLRIPYTTEQAGPIAPEPRDLASFHLPTDIKLPIRNIKWGAYLSTASPSAVSNFETLVGATMDIRAVFVGWGATNGQFPGWYASSLLAANKTLLMYWEPSDGDTGNTNQPMYNYDSISNGNWDTYISSFATSVKNYGGPVILVPFEEMNGDWYPWSGTNNSNSPAKEIAAWHHIHDIFAAQNVTNVKWGWAPNADSWPNTAANDLTAYYPGSSYVDIVGVDGFNFNQTNNPWQTFSQVFDPGLSKVDQYHKPIYLFSIASAEKNDGGAAKAAWITDTLVNKIPHYDIAGWIWFNENKEENWLVDSTTPALQAFKSAVQIY